ncbi:hypothetical protein Misp06_03409 [Microbulbifer sp. NBRC 101763]|uniref:hypothetical protein n=1 Tax=Microbulbifer TaxID=48073 RepID=UPI0012FB57CF|nr:hypothetical protein [Microbulbifer variabilis]
MKRVLPILLTGFAITLAPQVTRGETLYEREIVSRCQHTCRDIYRKCIRDNERPQNICVENQSHCDVICREGNRVDFYYDKFDSKYRSGYDNYDY